jgi:hypothetical protein
VLELEKDIFLRSLEKRGHNHLTIKRDSRTEFPSTMPHTAPMISLLDKRREINYQTVKGTVCWITQEHFTSFL